MKNVVRDAIHRIVELNRLEEEFHASSSLREKKRKLQTSIESLRAGLAPSVLLPHNRMRERGKKSVAAVYHGVCSGCHMALAIGNVNSLLRGDELRRCGNCGRYVYFAEESEAIYPITTAKRRTTPTITKSESELAPC